jgi:hypothetical protein
MSKTGFAILYLGAMVCLASAGTAQSQAALVDSFESEDALSNWTGWYGGTFSLETDPRYVASGKTSLKINVPRQSDYYQGMLDYPIGVRHTSVQVSEKPLGISMWMFPVNAGATGISLIDSDGTQATWEYSDLQPGQWNLLRVLVREARTISKAGVNSDLTMDDVAGVNIAVLKGVLSMGFEDQSQPAIYYVDDVRIITAGLAVNGRQGGDQVEGLHLDQTYWIDRPIDGALTLPAVAGQNARLQVAVRRNGQEIFQSSQRVSAGDRDFGFSVIFPVAGVAPPGAAAQPGAARTLSQVDSQSDDSHPLPEDSYQLEVSCDGHEYRRAFSVLGQNAYEARWKQVEKTSQLLNNMIKKWEHKGKDISYARAAWAVADRFLRVEGPQKATGHLHYNGVKQLRDAGVDMERCQLILEEAIADMKRGRERKVPVLDMTQVTLKGRNFYSEGEPVMLVGPLGYSYLWEEIESMGAMGFNLIDDEVACETSKFANTMMPPGTWGLKDSFFHIQHAYRIITGWKLLRALGINVAVAFNPETSYAPGWLYQHYPQTQPKPDSLWKGNGWTNYGPMEEPILYKLLETYYAALVKLVKDDPSLLLYWLQNEPQYWSHTPRYLKLFQQHLKEKYESAAALNSVWQTEYSDISEAEFPTQENKAAWYDWNVFHYGYVADFFRWQRDQVKKHHPEALTTVKLVADYMFLDAFVDYVGIDYEAFGEIHDVAGSDTFVNYHTLNPVRWNIRSGNLLFDFWTSVAPDKPISNTEFHQLQDVFAFEYELDRGDFARYIQTTYWQQYFHGMRLCTFWQWTDSSHYHGLSRMPVVTGQPTALYSTARTALDLRRLSKEVSIFPGRPEVAIYYSKPSLYLDGIAHMEAVTEVYTGLSYLDTPIGFVTDKMLLRGVDSRITMIVVPQAQYVRDDVYQALLSYVQAGGKLAVVGTSFGFDEKDRARNFQAITEMTTVAWIENEQAAQDYWRLFDPMLDEQGVSRPVRPVGPDGGRVWMVECRTLEQEGKQLTYLINLSRKVQNVTLEGMKGKAWELIEDQKVPKGPIQLRSFEVKLIKHK